MIFSFGGHHLGQRLLADKDQTKSSDKAQAVDLLDAALGLRTAGIAARPVTRPTL